MLADRLEREFSTPGLVGKVDAGTIRIVLAGFVGGTPFVIGVSLESLALECRVVAILEIGAGNGISGSSGRISVGEDNPAARHAERRHGHARYGQDLTGRGGRSVGQHAQTTDADTSILAGELAAA